VDDPRTYYWNLLLVHPLERALQFLATDLGLGAGLAIIVFTILMRVVLLPLTIQQFRSQKAMQQLQPELKELQKKFGKDKEKLQAETMQLYKERGVNPAAGCLPLVVQMPILFALYAALNTLAHTDPTFQQPFLWVHQLNLPDVIVVAGLSIPFILPILTAASQWVQQRMMTPQTDDPQQRLQNSMMQFMPLMMLYFGTTISAGVVLYWLTQNLFGIIQQYFQTGWGSLLPKRATAAASAGQAGISSGGGSGGTGGSGGSGGSGRSGGSGGGNGSAAPPGSQTSGNARPPGLPNPSRTGHRNGRRGGGGTPRREERRASGKR
jgi:YidC/Oxa1 family membrane protein insertase